MAENAYLFFNVRNLDDPEHNIMYSYNLLTKEIDQCNDSIRKNIIHEQCPHHIVFADAFDIFCNQMFSEEDEDDKEDPVHINPPIPTTNLAEWIEFCSIVNKRWSNGYRPSASDDARILTMCKQNPAAKRRRLDVTSVPTISGRVANMLLQKINSAVEGVVDEFRP